MKNFQKIILIVFFLGTLLSVGVALAATNINSGALNHWAWNDEIGWIDFYTSNTITVSSSTISGYATSPIGDIAFNCASTRNGNICGTSNFKVTNDGAGNLSGWAWNDTIGWISFDCNDLIQHCPPSYQATIDQSGDFHGWAWNEVIGWISLNCLNTNSCVTSQYKVNTAFRYSSASGYLESSIFDTGAVSGVSFNTITWQGSSNGGNIRFQLASSNNSTGPWNFSGPDNTNLTYYSGVPGQQIQITAANHNNQRYFKYKVFLESNAAQTAGPQIDDIIIGYSQ